MRKAPYFNRNGELVMPVDQFSQWLRDVAITQEPDGYLFLMFIAQNFDAEVAKVCLKAMEATE